MCVYSWLPTGDYSFVVFFFHLYHIFRLNSRFFHFGTMNTTMSTFSRLGRPFVAPFLMLYSAIAVGTKSVTWAFSPGRCPCVAFTYIAVFVVWSHCWLRCVIVLWSNCCLRCVIALLASLCDRIAGFVPVTSQGNVCWLLNVPRTCECISGTDLLRQFYVLPHWDRSCRSNFPPHPVAVYWHRADQFQHWPYNARRPVG